MTSKHEDLPSRCSKIVHVSGMLSSQGSHRHELLALKLVIKASKKDPKGNLKGHFQRHFYAFPWSVMKILSKPAPSNFCHDLGSSRMSKKLVLSPEPLGEHAVRHEDRDLF